MPLTLNYRIGGSGSGDKTLEDFFSSFSELLDREERFLAPEFPGKEAQNQGKSASAPASDRSSVATRDEMQMSLRAEAEWWGAITALSRLLRPLRAAVNNDVGSDHLGRALVLSGPLPVLQDPQLIQQVSSWLFMPQPLADMLAVARPQLPFQAGTAGIAKGDLLQTVPLAVDAPLAQERFCLVMTAHFSLSLVLGRNGNDLGVRFSFSPNVNQQIWRRLKSQIAHSRPPLLKTFEGSSARFPWIEPPYQVVANFSHLLLMQLRQLPTDLPQSSPRECHREPASNSEETSTTDNAAKSSELPSSLSGESAYSPDAALLKAMAHEIRTPLSTIRTYTRSLLKRQDLPEPVVKRLTQIDRECTQQIDRFSLIFRAVELETSDRHMASSLTPISLSRIFQDAIPFWQQQAQRRSLTLEVNLPPTLPMVTSDPAMLKQVFTGLIDRFTQSLPAGSHITLSVTLAGHQLKLQFQSQANGAAATAAKPPSPLQSVGQLLMFQPETGGLSLNLKATKNLFQALGGKLIVRQRPQTGEVLTVFLPLETRAL